MRNKSLKTLFAILLSSVLSNCAKVHIADAEWCGDMGKFGAACFHTLSDAEREIKKIQWDAERFGMLCTTADSFTNWKTAIQQLCSDSKLCTYEVRQTLERLSHSVRRNQEKVEKARPRR